MVSTSQKIAHAYGELIARGEKVTVRALQRQAGVRIGEVAAWMREHAAGSAGDVPEAPDLSAPMSAMVQAVWAVAWKRAAEQADEASAVALDDARTGEADALTAAERSGVERDEAVTARDDALREVEQLRLDVTRLREQLETAQQDAKDARAAAEEADRARVRAEATSDTLREILDATRLVRAGDRDTKQATAPLADGSAE